jgi:predicted enzyme related to lactoylglutathione lyase
MSDHHGLFIWYELITTDTAAAKAFYSKVVGWTTRDMDMGDMTYTVLEADGVGVGGMMLIPPEAKAMGAPPNWAGYIAVHDADATAAKITSLGGSVIRPPQDIPNIGRFAIVADPHGAVFAIMAPAPMETAPPRLSRGAVGHTDWHELYAGEPEADFTFYSELFGWKKDEAMDMGPMGTYQIFANGDGVVGAMMKKPDPVPRPAWGYYFQVGDIDAAVERVTSAGGQVTMGPMEVPGEEWVIQGRDPQGAAFALVGKRG